jgi:hypothetical protein
MDVLVNYSQLGEAAGCEFNHLVPAYIDNLCRLGLADVPPMFIYMAPGIYDSLEQSPVVVATKAQIELNPDLAAKVERRGLKITELGKQFARICVARKA